MIREADAVVIGAGALGASVAFHLARRGRRVALLDRFELVSQTSPRAAGLTQQIRRAPVMAEVARRGVAAIRRFADDTGEPMVFHQSGSLKIARRPEDVPGLRHNVELGRSLGLAVEWITPAEAHQLMPLLQPVGMEAIAYVPTDVYLDPAQLPLGYVRAAARLGATLLPNTPVTGILRDGGRVQGVRTEQGTIAAPVVVDTAGAWARLVGELADVRVPVVPTRHQLLVTEPVEGVADEQPIVRIVDTNVYVRPDRGGLMLGGYESDPMQWRGASLAPDLRVETMPLDRSVLDRLAQSVAAQFPIFQRAAVREHRGGLPTMTADGLPIVGPVAALPGLYVAAGCNVGGLSTSPAHGDLLAEWIVEGRPSVDLSPLRLERFGPEWDDDHRLAEAATFRYSHHYHSREH